jgi:molybdopterin-containing oxidoreductase family iron-sulfur binding subunit
MPLGRYAYGLIVETHESRPTKIEGNTDHPATMGMSNAMIQASILGLYDPDRSQNVRRNEINAEWSDFENFWNEKHTEFKSTGGEGLAVLTESYSSPTMSRLEKEFGKNFPDADWVVYEPASDENRLEGIKIATGGYYQPVYHYDKARVILSLDSDFLQNEDNNITAALGFTDGRRIKSEKDDMNRLYVVESDYSLTGSMADHRYKLKSGEITGFTMALLHEIANRGGRVQIPSEFNKYKNHSFNPGWIKAVTEDLIANEGRTLVLAGYNQPAIVHAVVEIINQALGSHGNTIDYKAASIFGLPNTNQFLELVDKINEDGIDTLIILGGNPVYNTPTDLKFSSLINKVKNTIHISPYYDETSSRCGWHIPQAHYLESWDDATSIDGTDSIIQPMIEPLFGGKTSAELLNYIISNELESAHKIIRKTWSSLNDSRWKKALYDGFISGKKTKTSKTRFSLNRMKNYLLDNPILEVTTGRLEVVLRRSPKILDGRFANNGWLQEMPDSLTKISWDNAAVMSISTAEEYNLKNGDFVEISNSDYSMEIPVWILPGHADNSISLTLGYGREISGRIGNGVGFNCYKILTSENGFIINDVKLRKLDRSHSFASTQDHGSMEGRPLIRESDIEQYRQHPDFAPEMVEHPELKSLWDEHKYDKGYQWGMTIDLNVCIGCNACTIACQSENNIPIVGKDQVRDGREMHWIRLDRYFDGDTDDPNVIFQPVGCQHCEMAPCEQVCPVAATVHDKEGLNAMVYNRCVGTRYCANNCPYKVRRFNFMNFTNETPEIVQLAQNPDVTIRSRGVMEKCTYCLQRISEAKINAKSEGREIQDGEVLAACQQSCPAKAIEFGNINDLESKVSKSKNQNRNYGLLAEFNTRPRTTFLAKIRNPNPALKKIEKKNDSH